MQRLETGGRRILVLAALATGMIALWLFTVVGTVLPRQDPAHLGLWPGLAIALLAYAGFTLAFALRGGRPAWLAAIVVACSLAALAFGGYAVAIEVGAAQPGTGTGGGHFEGYLLVMGAVLSGDGLCALGYAAITARRARVVCSSGA